MNESTADTERPSGSVILPDAAQVPAVTGGELAQPLPLPCGAVLRNRLVKSAMSEGLGDRANNPTEDLIRLFERWSSSGASLLITGNVMIDRRSLGEPGNVVLEDDEALGDVTRWAGAAKAGDALAIMQINHPGRQIPPYLSPRVVAPSAVRMKAAGTRFPMPRALTGPEIEELVERFATTAGLAVTAGFDGVQLHGAHGYLISEFLSPLVNRRDDEWGGDPERRRRFAIEVTRAVRREIGPRRILSVKLNSADFQRGGFDEEESLQAIVALEAEGVDLLEISGGSYERPAMMGHRKASTAAREAYFLEFAKRARAAVKMPLMLTGGLRSAAGMTQALHEGVDAIGIGRPLCLEPDLPIALLADPGTVSKLKPIGTGVRALDPPADLFWNAIQLRRMAAGKEPDPRLGGRQALVRALARDGIKGLRKKRAG